MTSVVHYRFKAIREGGQVQFEGGHITLGELKKSIAQQKKLGGTSNAAANFDLVVANAQSMEEYRDDGHLIPKNTMVIVRRVPSSGRQGSGISMRQQLLRAAERSLQPVAGLGSGGSVSSTGAGDEEERIRSMAAKTGQLQAQTTLAQVRANRAVLSTEKREPPLWYVCRRCNQSGHYIQDCPTNGDPKYDVPRGKPPTGIPKSFLRQVADQGAAGSYVVYNPNASALEKLAKLTQRKKRETAQAGIPEELLCGVCRGLLLEPTRSPCCNSVFCDRCIKTTLIEDGLVCPSCKAENVMIDKLAVDNELKEHVIEFRAQRQGAMESSRNDSSSDRSRDRDSQRDHHHGGGGGRDRDRDRRGPPRDRDRDRDRDLEPPSKYSRR